MNRIFLDANLIFTAVHNPAGRTADLLAAIRAGYHRAEVVTCRLAADEAERNLALKAPRAAGGLADVLEGIELQPTVLERSCNLALPREDTCIFLTAVRARCTHLLTGDVRHFGAYMNAPERCSGVCIQIVAQYVSHLGGAGPETGPIRKASPVRRTRARTRRGR